MTSHLPRVSLKARLALAFATGMAVVLLAVAVFVYLQLRGNMLDSVNMGLRSRAQLIVSNAQHRDPSLGANPRHLIDNDEAFAQILSPSGRIVESTPAVDHAALVSPHLLASTHTAKLVDRTPQRRDPARLLIIPTDTGGHKVFVVVGATLSNTYEALGHVKLMFEIAIPAAILVCSVIGWFLAGAALRPVERMSAEAAHISETDPNRRLAIPDTDDTLTRLAETLNSTFDRLQQAHDRERRFVDDASHELRTPLAILKAEVDTALHGTREKDDLEHTLQSASEEIEHLIRIAEGLLILARSNHGQIPINPTPTPLPNLIHATAAAFNRTAATHDIQIDAHTDDTIVWVDPTRLRQAVDNLIENALRHTPRGGTITIAATTPTPDTLTITVEDCGDGFAPDALHHAFQPFNHPDSNHGSGLGLAIVQAIAHAHGGSANTENLPHRGARVTLTVHAPHPHTTRRDSDAGLDAARPAARLGPSPAPPSHHPEPPT